MTQNGCQSALCVLTFSEFSVTTLSFLNSASSILRFPEFPGSVPFSFCVFLSFALRFLRFLRLLVSLKNAES